MSPYEAARRLQQADPDAFAALLRTLEIAADHRTMPTSAHTLGRVQEAIRGFGGEVPR